MIGATGMNKGTGRIGMTGTTDMTITGTEIRLSGDKTCASWSEKNQAVNRASSIKMLQEGRTP